MRKNTAKNFADIAKCHSKQFYIKIMTGWCLLIYEIIVAIIEYVGNNNVYLNQNASTIIVKLIAVGLYINIPTLRIFLVNLTTLQLTISK